VARAAGGGRHTDDYRIPAASHARGAAWSVTTYAKFANIIDNQGYDLCPVTRMAHPAEMDIRRLSHTHEYSVHSPPAARGMLQQAIKEGWDHFEWKGLCLGLKPQSRECRVASTQEDSDAAIRVLGRCHPAPGSPCT